MKTYGDLISRTLHRLGDDGGSIWTTDEVLFHLGAAQSDLATKQRVFFDWTWLENLPPSFSVTQPWELLLLDPGMVNTGVANYTCDFERTLFSDYGNDERQRIGPAWYTSPFEATDLWLSDVHANTAISATADVPDEVASLDRVTWDKRGINAMTPALMERLDARYQITTGEVYGFMWQRDGVRTLRKIRVPSAQSDAYAIDGSWGILRDPTLISTDTCTGYDNVPMQFNHTQPWEEALMIIDGILLRGCANTTAAFEAAMVTFSPVRGPAWYTADFESADRWLVSLNHNTPVPTTVYWGIPRILPGMFPQGDGDGFGLPRRPYQDGKNVRLEVYRQGRVPDNPTVVCELPDRYALYLCDYAQWQLLSRRGPGQDLKLAEHFRLRWVRDTARIANRIDRMERAHVSILGGDGQSLTTRPPRPKLPWNYGSVVRW